MLSWRRRPHPSPKPAEQRAARRGGRAAGWSGPPWPTIRITRARALLSQRALCVRRHLCLCLRAVERRARHCLLVAFIRRALHIRTTRQHRRMAHIKNDGARVYIRSIQTGLSTHHRGIIVLRGERLQLCPKMHAFFAPGRGGVVGAFRGGRRGAAGAAPPGVSAEHEDPFVDASSFPPHDLPLIF